MQAMLRHWFKMFLPVAVLLAGLLGMLFSNLASSGKLSLPIQTVALEIQAAARDAGTQWMVMVCLAGYLAAFLVLERRLLPQENAEGAEKETGSRSARRETPDAGNRSFPFAVLVFFRGNVSNPNFWLTGLVGIVLLRYAFAYESAARSLQPLVLLAGIVFGKGVALWVAWQPSLKAKDSGLKLGEGSNAEGPTINSQPSSNNKARAILYILILLLAASALWQPEYGMDFQYRGQRRWTGAWDNPNLYGLLMGVGVVLAVGLFVQSRSTAECPPFNYQLKTIHYAQGLLLLAAAGLCAYGLVKSYSRGAWLGTACGLSYLVWFVTTIRVSEQFILGELNCGGLGKPISWFTRNWRPLCVLLASVLVLSFWQFRHTENPLARRVFSVGNLNDFSWRNRVATWAGAVTMMQGRPWAGHGWGKAEAVLGEKYKPVRLEDAAAIQMNDYLMLGISCGVPALLCFVAYIWLSCRRPLGASRARTELQPSALSLPPSFVAAAGATVLLVGFWFDGGLFKLPTGAVFWLLVELARIFPLPASGHPLPVRRGEGQGEGHGSSPRQIQIGLRWLAGVLALLAIGQTALHLGTPRLAVSERSLSIARQFLVPPKAKKDFEFQAAEPIWSAKKLATLLEHVELANYNRELVNWKLADDVYHRFVLSPPIDPALDGDMNWRRPLWESFYPRIRKENSLEGAAEIIVRLLRERVRVGETPGSPETIAEIWQRGIASERGFEAIYVAALRSAGIPARLAERGRAEFWNGAEWQPFH